VAAVLVDTYWFAFLHASPNPVVVLLLRGIRVLPMTYLLLRRGLETAIGFHFCVDLVRFLAAYVAFQGIRLR
jgi:membrane protease YdiL (CAAX protease family)